MSGCSLQEVIDSVLGTNLSGRVNSSLPNFLKGLRTMDAKGAAFVLQPD